MKKLAIIVGVVVLVAGIASAYSLNVPFFRDDPDGEKSFVGLHNNLDTDLTIGLIYYNQDGVQLAYEPGVVSGNTATIPPKASISFRPVSDSTADEGPVANSIPDRPRWSGAADGAEDTKLNGSIEISWDGGGAQALQGRLLDTAGVGNAATAYSFLLPPGGAAAK